MEDGKDKRSAFTTNRQSVTEIPNFPFETYEEFVAAYREARVLVLTCSDYRILDTVASWPTKLLVLLIMYGGVGIAAGFAVAAYVTGNGWLMLGVFTSLLGVWRGSPNVNLIDGFLPALASILGFIGGVILWNPSVVFSGLASYGVWFLSCIGHVSADTCLRSAMVESEATMLWVYEQGGILDFVFPRKPTSNPDVWPPPPMTQT